MLLLCKYLCTYVSKCSHLQPPNPHPPSCHCHSMSRRQYDDGIRRIMD